MKIAVIQRVLPPYRVGPLDRIGAELEPRGGELVVIHSDPDPKAGAGAARFRQVRVPSVELAGAVLQGRLIRALPADCDLVVAELGLRLVAMPRLLGHCRRRGIAFAWWGSGWEAWREAWREAGPGPGDWARRAWRRRLAVSADGIIAYGHRARDFYGSIGVPRERIHVAPNAVDTIAAGREAEAVALRHPRRESARAELDLAGRRVFLFLGRLLDYKRVDRLIEALSRVARRHPETCALIVGDGPERDHLELLAGRIAPDRVRFVGACDDPAEKALCYRAAEALVLPAQAGLAVNEALAHGVPVLCGSSAGPELEALQSGRNGLFVDAAGEQTLEAAIEALVRDAGLAERLRRGAQRTRGHDVRTMVRGFLDGAEAVARRVAAAPLPVLVMGPLPPPVHGVAVMFRTLLDELADDLRVVLHHVPVGDPHKARGFGVLSFRNARVALHDLLRGALRLALLRPRVAYLSLSQNRWAFLRDALLILAAKGTGADVVAHLHGAHFARFRSAASVPHRRFIDLVLRRIDRAVVLGEGLRGIFGPAVAPERVRVVPNGVDVRSDDRAPAGAGRASRARPFRVLFLGVLDETKGFRELIRALPALRRASPGAELIIAGRWESELLRREVWREIDELELEEAVRFTGVVTGEPKATLFDEADVFCLPTFYPLEGLPVVILEAMAAGLPVVSTERGAIPDVVRDGESGFLIPERNPRALAEALATLAHDPALRTAMGERGRALQREHYTAARFAGRIAEVLLEPGSESASRQRFGSAEVPAR